MENLKRVLHVTLTILECVISVLTSPSIRTWISLIPKTSELAEILKLDIDAVHQEYDNLSPSDLEELKKRLELQRKLETSISELRHAYEKESGALNQHKKSLKILDEVPCGDEYPKCKFIKDAHISKASLSGQEKKTSTALKVLEDAQKALTASRDDSLVENLS